MHVLRPVAREEEETNSSNFAIICLRIVHILQIRARGKIKLEPIRSEVEKVECPIIPVPIRHAIDTMDTLL